MKTFKLLLSFLLLLFFKEPANAQFGNVWTFGNGYGIDFNSGQPVQLPLNSILSAEGCATVCDSSGQLLFYTNGESVWDRNNNLMQNGDSIGGDQSSTQSSTIIPFPNLPSKYFIFTTDRESGGKGLRYSIVDLALNSGYGAVITKSQFLTDSICEKLSVTRHCNGVDWWVVVRKSNSDYFVSYLVNSQGVDTVPVYSLSNLGLFQTPGLSTHSIKYGQMKISPNGKLIACAYRNAGIEIANFNNLNGNVSSIIMRDFSVPNFDAYGLSFTSDNMNLFYGNRFNSQPPGTPLTIARVSLNHLNEDSILASKVLISLNDFNTILADSIILVRSFQLASDNYIYAVSHVQDTVLNVYRLQLLRMGNIDNSVSMDTVERLPIYFITGNLIVGSGLPAFYDGIYTNHHKASLRLPLCNSPFPFDSIPFFDSLLTVTRDYSWDFGDPSSGTNNYSNLQHPIHQYSATGTYTVTLTLESDCNPIVVTQQVLVTQVPPSIPLVSLNMGHLESTPADNYQWFFEGAPITGAVFQQYFPTQTGNYTVQVSNPSGCTATSLPFNVTAVQLKELQAFPNFSMLQNENLITLQCNTITDCFQSAELIDLQGRVLQSYAYQQKQSKVEINISELQSGVYLLRVNGRGLRKIQKN